MILAKRKSRKGFTLIELLVVIAIIAILAAILFPIFTRARSKAREVTCLNNMKQLGTALTNYARDYSGRFPHPYTGSWDTNTWRTIIRAYMGDDYSVLICPDPTAYFNKDYPPPKPDTRGHYGMNFVLTWDINTKQFAASYIEEISLPAETILIGENYEGDWEAEPWQGISGMAGPPVPPGIPDGVNGTGRFYPYHSGGGCFIFCDGHAKFLKTGSVDSPRPGGTMNYYYWVKSKTGQE